MAPTSRCSLHILGSFIIGDKQVKRSIELSFRAHKRTRAAVERGIGQLKRRWGLLHGEARLSPVKTCK